MTNNMTRNALLVLAKCILITAALAQNNDHFLAYGTFSPVLVSNATTGDVTTGFLSSTDQTGSVWAPGVGGGVTWNFLHPGGSLTFGLDLRGSTKPGTRGADTVMLGFVLAGRPAGSRFRPYGELAVGYLDTRATNTSPGSAGQTNVGTFRAQYIAFEAIGGVDYSLRDHVDLRLCELGIGAGSEFALFQTDPRTPILFTLNTGVVFHF